MSLLFTIKRQNFLKTLSYFLISVIVFEIFVQLFIIKTPKVHVVPGYGMVPVDNSVGIWGVEGYGVTHYLLNGEIRTPYENGVSVVVLGDSFTEATQVSDDEKYVSLAEKILHEKGVDVDLHNFGLSGRNIADYVYLAENIRKTYLPKIVIFQIGASDFMDAFNSSRPNYFVVENDRAVLVHQDNYFYLDAQNLIRNSGLGSLFIYRFKNILDDLRFGKTRQPSETPGNNLQTDRQNSTRDQQLLMDVEILQNAYPNSQIVFLVIPNYPEIKDQSVIWSGEDDAWVLDRLGQYDDSIVVYPIAGFRELYDKKKAFPRGFSNTLPDYGHLNSDGHQAVAEMLADVLEKLLK